MTMLQAVQIRCGNCLEFRKAELQKLPLNTPSLQHGKCNLDTENGSGKPDNAPDDWPQVTVNEQCNAFKPREVA
jgi:hypothetical protein